MFNNFASNVGESLTSLEDEFDKMINDEYQHEDETSTSGVPPTNQETFYIPRLHQTPNKLSPKSSPLNRATNRVSWRFKAATEQVKRKFSITATKASAEKRASRQNLSASSGNLNQSTESIASSTSNKHSKNQNNNYISKENNFVIGLCKKINSRLASSSTSTSSSDDDVSMETFPVPLESVMTSQESRDDAHLLIPPVMVNGQVVRDYQYLSLRYKGNSPNNNHQSQQNPILTTVVRAIRGETPKSPLKILYNDTMMTQSQSDSNNANNNNNDDNVITDRDLCRRSKVRTQIRRHASVIIN